MLGAAGITEIALTEHLFRFAQADALLRGFWEDVPDAALRASMAAYWDDHARADFDVYVECVLEAKAGGLPVVLGLEVDYYRGRMDDVASLLAGYPFDVLLGSVHWIGAWRFDDVDDDVSMAQWSTRDVDAVWDDYTGAIEEARRLGHMRRPGPPRPGEGRRPPARRPRGVLGSTGRGGAWARAWPRRSRRRAGASRVPRPTRPRACSRASWTAWVPLTTASDAHRLPDVAYRAAAIAGILADAGVQTLRAYRGRRAFDVPAAAEAARR